MSELPVWTMPPNEPELSLTEELEIDEFCAAFEGQLAAGDKPLLTDYVDRAPERLRARLDRELRLLLEELESAGDAGAASDLQAELHERFGHYRIVRRIGRGGMGTVYEAIQDHPRRRVALKVIRPDLISPRLRQRFGREIRLLAHLQHPGIAHVLEAGSAPIAEGGAAVPYLAMEFVVGRPLLDFAAERKLGTRDRVALVRQLAGAIQHAHDEGIVHRDLKPANVLVTPPGSSAGGSSRPRGAEVGRAVILDFGVARAIGAKGRGTLETVAGQVLGTLSHMAPEQFEGEHDRVDGRCDVYALGVILFELLAGRLPIPLDGLSTPAAMDRIRTLDPPPLGSIARGLRGDLEVIVAKTLEKDPARRFASALELAEDLQRYLDDEPIRARPASALYQLRKFGRRNPGLVAVVATGTLFLIVALVVVSIFAARQTELRGRAQSAAQAAELEAAKAVAIADFQRDMLRRANLDHGGKTKDISLLDVLTGASEELEGAFLEQPLVEASLRHTIGAAFSSLQEHEVASRHLSRASELRTRLLGADHGETLEARSALGVNLERAGQYEAALREHRAILETLRGRDGVDAEALATTTGNLAVTLEALGRYEESLELHAESLELNERAHGPESPQVAQSLNNYATAIEYSGDFERAEPLYRQALAIRRAKLDAPHARLANSINNLGALYLHMGRLDEAQALLAEALAMRDTLLGADHPITAQSIGNLASLFLQRGDLARAEDLYRQALAIQLPRHAPDHRNVRTLQHSLATILVRRGSLDEALELRHMLVEASEHSVGREHRDTLTDRLQLARLLVDLGRFDEADPELLELEADCRRALGEDAVTASAIFRAAGVAERWGDVAYAAELMREAIDMMAAERGATHRWTLEFRASEVAFLLRHASAANDYAERARLGAAEGLDDARATLGDEDACTQSFERMARAAGG